VEAKPHSGRYKITETEKQLVFSFPPQQNKILVYVVLPVFLLPALIFWFIFFVYPSTPHQVNVFFPIITAIVTLILILLFPFLIVAQQWEEIEALTLTVESLTYQHGFLWFKQKQHYLCNIISNLQIHEERFKYEYHPFRNSNSLKAISDLADTTSGAIEFMSGSYKVTILSRLNRYEAKKILEEMKDWYGKVGDHQL
jgi:hypothetical protein